MIRGEEGPSLTGSARTGYFELLLLRAELQGQVLLLFDEYRAGEADARRSSATDVLARATMLWWRSCV